MAIFYIKLPAVVNEVKAQPRQSLTTNAQPCSGALQGRRNPISLISPGMGKFARIALIPTLPQNIEFPLKRDPIAALRASSKIRKKAKKSENKLKKCRFFLHKT